MFLEQNNVCLRKGKRGRGYISTTRNHVFLLGLGSALIIPVGHDVSPCRISIQSKIFITNLISFAITSLLLWEVNAKKRSDTESWRYIVLTSFCLRDLEPLTFVFTRDIRHFTRYIQLSLFVIDRFLRSLLLLLHITIMASTEQALSDYVTLVSNDGFEFKIQRNAAIHSPAISRMLNPKSTFAQLSIRCCGSNLVRLTR